jgi:predicted ATPase
MLEALAQEFRAHVSTGKGSSQIFVTTHQPYFVDAMEPDEVWILEKGDDGFSIVRRASADKTITALVNEGIQLGSLWFSDYLDGGERDAF